MNEKSVRKVHLAVAWTGPLCLLTFVAGWIVLSHNYPPPDPMFSPQQLVDEYYIKYRAGIMLGMSLAACFGMLYMPWTCLLAAPQRLRSPSTHKIWRDSAQSRRNRGCCCEGARQR